MNPIEKNLKELYPNVLPWDNVVFIGFDPRETIAYMVAKHSIERLSPNVKVFPLYSRDLKKAGIYNRPMIIDNTGQFKDVREDRPQSVDFSFTRFLVPRIARYLGIKGYVIFCDCDFLFKFNLNDLFRELNEQHTDSPLALVKHNFRPTTEIKMDGVSQLPYSMKLWSAFMCFNTNHPDLDSLHEDIVNHTTGLYLHKFAWLKDVNSIIGLSEAYQYIPGHSNNNISSDEEPKIIHYTEKAPWFHGDMAITENSEDWWSEVAAMKNTISTTSRYTRFWE